MTVNTNGFLNNYVKIYATDERFTFTGGARADENLILFRTHSRSNSRDWIRG